MLIKMQKVVVIVLIAIMLVNIIAIVYETKSILKTMQEKKSNIRKRKK